MSIQIARNIGAEISVKQSAPPSLSSAGTITGAAVDRLVNGGLAQSCKVGLHLGAATGSPDSVSATTVVEHSADGSTGWAAYKPDGVTQAGSTSGNAAVSTDSNFSVDLTMAYRYIRTVTTLGISGGTTPKCGHMTSVVLGGFPNKPIATPAP